MFRRTIRKTFNIACIVILLLHFFFCKLVFVFFRYRLEYIAGGGGDDTSPSLILRYDTFSMYICCVMIILQFFSQVANPGLSDKMIAHKPNMFLKQNKTSATPILRILTTEWYLEALSATVKPYYMYMYISLPCKQIMMI